MSEKKRELDSGAYFVCAYPFLIAALIGTVVFSGMMDGHPAKWIGLLIFFGAILMGCAFTKEIIIDRK